MQEIFIPSTEKTPQVVFKSTGELELSGKSIPEDAETFFDPILKWLESYISQPCPLTTLSINLEYFNISSSKRILFILYKLNELVGQNKSVRVRWVYDDNDEDMYEVGQDYAFMVKIPFEFVEVDRAHVLNEKLEGSSKM